jgi:hypothetical protein
MVGGHGAVLYHAIILSPLVVVQQTLAVVVGMIVCACKLKTGTENIAKEILFHSFVCSIIF